jgi:8-hydroxy-5-deazaflavin:NADPH oxidoreductase
MDDADPLAVAILGAGRLGIQIGRRLAASGHHVTMSFATSPERLRAAAEQVGHGAAVGEPAQVVAHADIVILTVPWPAAIPLVSSLELAGKIVWDCTNPLKEDMSGLSLGTDTSAGEQLAAVATEARVVKAIPPFAERLAAPPIDTGTKPAVFLCSDDASAAQVVAYLVPLLGAQPVIAGPLSSARFTEPAGMLLVRLAYDQGLGGHIGLSLLPGEATR